MSDLAELPKLTKTFLDRGNSVEEVASKLNLDVQLAWSIALEGFNGFTVTPSMAHLANSFSQRLLYWVSINQI